MRRLLSIWFTNWPIDRMARETPGAVPDNKPFALVASSPRGLVITACNARAQDLGVRQGLTLADARAALPTLQTRPAEPFCDHASLLKLVRWANRYGPLYNIDGPDGLWIDITGVAHLFKGEGCLARDLLRRLSKAQISTRLGLADTLGAAHALARFATKPSSPIAIAAPGTTRETLIPLPIESLRLEADSVHLLRRLGLRRVGDLLPLPRAALEHRFRAHPAKDGNARSARKKQSKSLSAPQAVWAARNVLASLDKSLGLQAEPRAPLVTPAPHMAREIFAEPLLHAEAVMGVLDRLIETVCAELAASLQAARRFRLVMFRVDASAAEAIIGTSSACREAAHIQRLFADQLENLDAGFGVDAMVLEALEMEEQGHISILMDAALGAHARSDLSQLIDRLANRLGDDRVSLITPNDSHIPERAWLQISARRQAHKLLGAHQTSTSLQMRAEAAGPIESTNKRKPSRPTFLLARPEAIKVLALIPDGAPVSFTWRRVKHIIAKAEGPERIAPEWWRELGTQVHLSAPPADPSMADLAPHTRDYYRIEDETGGQYWVFRHGLYAAHQSPPQDPEGNFGQVAEASLMAGAPTWFVHGIFGS